MPLVVCPVGACASHAAMPKREAAARQVVDVGGVPVHTGEYP
jgi:hypothetical protein